MGIKRFVGDRSFYKRLFAIMTPILIQNVITNFVSLLDNVMVGQVGTEQMSGVAIVNQMIFVFNLCIFGGLAGAGIFAAQFFGKKDELGVRHVFRIKFYISAISLAVFLGLFLAFGQNFISLFLHEGKEQLDLAATLNYGMDYLHVMIIQMFPFALAQVYSGTLRETGETMLPMKAGIIAVFVNVFFNYVFIFGKFGVPAMGVVGAAVATVIARFAECFIVIIWTHRHKDRNPYIIGAYSSFKAPAGLVRQVTVVGFPLLINETLWSLGMLILNQCYSVRGLEVVSAFNISSTINNLFFCAALSMGNTIAIIIGQLLGAGELKRAIEDNTRLTAFSVALCAVIGGAMAALAHAIPQIYNTTDTVKSLAAGLLIVSAVMMPLNAYIHACYFTMRSGGKTIITFIFDCLFLWTLSIPLAFVFSRYTDIPVVEMFAIIESINITKAVLGFFLVRSRKWVNNLVEDK